MHELAATVEDLDKEIILPESHLWAILARDSLRNLALTRGLPRMRIELGDPLFPALKGMLFILKFHHPADSNEGTTVLDLDAVFGNQRPVE